jgi:hypothetical protein
VDQAKGTTNMDEGQRDRKSPLVEFLSYPFIALLVLWIQVQALRAMMLPTSPKRARSRKERPTRQPEKKARPANAGRASPTHKGLLSGSLPRNRLRAPLGDAR